MRRPRLAFILVAAILFSMGLLMVYNTSSADILDRALDAHLHQAMVRQIVYAIAGVAVGFAVWWLGYRQLLQLSLPMLLLTSFLLLLVFVPGIGLARNGAHRWIRLAGYTLQPSELAKLTLPLYFISAISRRARKGGPIDLLFFGKVVAIVGLPMLLILLEPDNATIAIFGMIFLVLFFLTRIPFRFWLIPILLFGAVGGTVALQLPYVSHRIQVYLHPEMDLQGRGHQPYQAKIAAGSGELWGKGLGESLQKLTYLPEAQNDYIAAIYAEELGWAGMVLLILLYALLAAWGYQMALCAADLEGFYVAGAMTFLIALQVFLNLAVVSGLIPSTGLNLPLFSQGGSSLMANLVAIGLLLSVDREPVWVRSKA